MFPNSKLETAKVARSICAEGNVINEAVRAEQGLMHRRQQPVLALPAALELENNEKEILRAPTPKELLRDELLASAKARGEVLNPVLPSTFALVNKEFLALTGEQKQRFKARSDLLRSVAKENRRKRKLKQADQRQAMVCLPTTAPLARCVQSPSAHMAGLVASCRCSRGGSHHELIFGNLNSMEPSAEIMDGDKSAMFPIVAGNVAKRVPQHVDGNHPLSVPVIERCLAAKDMKGAYKSSQFQLLSWETSDVMLFFVDFPWTWCIL